jgi:2-polyprenyl-6-methoxyphenol hydroxylase-like FAD-dependent oxidoreductase
VVHPLAGQGVNLGLEDATSLVRNVQEAVETGHDIGTFELN